MTKIPLTIGMAVYDDMIGVLDTIQDLRIHHAAAMRSVEIVVVDNHPDSEHGRDTRKFVTAYGHVGTAGAKYVPMPEAQGTTQPRERVFREASGRYVLCIDSHVKMLPGSISGLLDWIARNPDRDDLFHGPMIYDCLRTQSTEMLDAWRGGMWGIWADLPHDDEPGEEYTLFAHGLGLFGCRREAWTGFHPEFREFGGEECYIHEKFRSLGRRCIGLRFLRWWHRFWQPESSGKKYRRTSWGMARNYILGHQELGLPLDRAYEHLVIKRGAVSPGQWEQLVMDAAKATPPLLVEPRPSTGPDRIALLYDRISEDHEAEAVRVQAEQHDHVTVIGHGERLRALATAAAAARPKVLHIYDLSGEGVAELSAAVKATPDRDGKRIAQYEVIAAREMPPISLTELVVGDAADVGTVLGRVSRRALSRGDTPISAPWRRVGLRGGLVLIDRTAE